MFLRAEELRLQAGPKLANLYIDVGRAAGWASSGRKVEELPQLLHGDDASGLGELRWLRGSPRTALGNSRDAALGLGHLERLNNIRKRGRKEIDITLQPHELTCTE